MGGGQHVEETTKQRKTEYEGEGQREGKKQ
jgi:hypothetical protein